MADVVYAQVVPIHRALSDKSVLVLRISEASKAR